MYMRLTQIFKYTVKTQIIAKFKVSTGEHKKIVMYFEYRYKCKLLDDNMVVDAERIIFKVV